MILRFFPAGGWGGVPNLLFCKGFFHQTNQNRPSWFTKILVQGYLRIVRNYYGGSDPRTCKWLGSHPFIRHLDPFRPLTTETNWDDPPSKPFLAMGYEKQSFFAKKRPSSLLLFLVYMREQICRQVECCI